MAVYMKIGYICTIKFLMQTKFNINYLRQWRKVKRGRGYLRKAENFFIYLYPTDLIFPMITTDSFLRKHNEFRDIYEN